MYLESRRFQQKEFARAIGISPSSISQYLSGLREPSLKIGRMIERYTNGKVTIDDLLAYYEAHKKVSIEKDINTRMEENRV